MKPLVLAALVPGLWLGGAAASPQEPIEPPPILTAETNLVTLSLTVADRRGNLVAGLTRDDFTVYDNGETRPIEFFSNEEMPATIGLVIDCSTSMRGRREQLSAAAGAFADLSNPLDELFTVNFNDDARLGLPAGLPFTGNREQLRAVLASTPAWGRTALYDGLDLALTHVETARLDRKALIVVSDGGDNASTHTLADVLDYARWVGAVIYSVALADRDNRESNVGVLKQLARETGGRTFTPRHPDDVLKAFTQIARELRAGYTIGFVPPEMTSDGFRAVRVVADAGNGSRLVVRTREGYYATPSRP